MPILEYTVIYNKDNNPVLCNKSNSQGVTMPKKIYIRLKVIPLVACSVIALIFTDAYPEKNSGLVNLTVRINTTGDDYAPSLTADGSTAVFNSRMPVERSHNIFICKNKNGVWSDPYPVFVKSSDFNDETPFISADGKTMLFASDRPGGFSPPMTSDGIKRITFDIYISRLENGKWSEPELLKGAVNTNMNERAPGLSADGRTLYFTRWPYNSPGKSKIYSAKLEDGEYKNIKALPSMINTGNFEIGFRPSYKSGRYYFASRRPGGSGGWDIYYTTIDGKGFTRPVNAGREINTPYDDMYYSESKINSIMCSDRPGGTGKFDLYSSIPAEKTIPAEIEKEHSQPKQTAGATETVLRIKAIDRKSGKLMRNKSFRILLLGEREKETVFLRKTVVKSGDRGSFTLNPKDDVDSIVVETASKGFYGCSIKVHVIHGQAQDITLYLDRRSSTYEEKAPVKEKEQKPAVEEKTSRIKPDENTGLPALKTVYFRFNSYQIPVEYIPELHIVVEFMRNNPEYRITISGYADSSGSSKSNDILSMKRSNSVADFIRSLDIDRGRITVKWYGKSRSVSGWHGSRYASLDRKVEIELHK